MMESTKIVLCGLGRVGKELVQLLVDRGAEIEKKCRSPSTFLQDLVQYLL